MDVFKDAQTLYRLIKPNKGKNHAERLENFYSSQAADYDQFRQRLLPGRLELMKLLANQSPSGQWADLGSGTGSNVECIDLKNFQQIYLVDLSLSLLTQAENRLAKYPEKNIQLIRQDIINFKPTKPLDMATFSYSLTMVPEWFKAIDNAIDNLKPGGLIGVADFYISKKHPHEARAKHSAFTRHFWPIWFSWDNVFLNSDHLPYLMSRLETLEIIEDTTSLPYLPGSQVPYYVFVGRKK